MTNGAKCGLLPRTCSRNWNKGSLQKSRQNENSYNCDHRKPGEGRFSGVRTKIDTARRVTLMKETRLCCNVVETTLNWMQTSTICTRKNKQWLRFNDIEGFGVFINPVELNCLFHITELPFFIETTKYKTKASGFRHSGFSGLEVACWTLVPKFAGSNPTEAVGLFRTEKKNPQRTFLRRGSKAVCPMS